MKLWAGSTANPRTALCSAIHRGCRVGVFSEFLESRRLLSGTPTVSVTVPGTAGPWATVGENSAYAYGIGDQTAPAVVSTASGIPFAPGEYLQIRYVSGIVNAGSGYGTGDARGVPNFPVNALPGSTGTDFPSKSVAPSDYPANLVCLIGTFADSSGNVVGTPFVVNDDRYVTIPTGAARLQLGANDDQFVDNSGSWDVAVSVGGVESQIAFTSQPASLTVNDPATFSVSVIGLAGTTTPTGIVTFSENGTILGNVALNGNANASFSTTALPVGNDVVTATYLGDINYLGSSASSASIAVSSIPVSPSPPPPPTTGLTGPFNSPLATTLIGRLPSAPVVCGTNLTPITQSIRLTNTSAATLNGVVTIMPYVSPDSTGSTDATQIGSPIYRRIRLRPHASLAVPLRLSSIPSSATGTLSILAEVTDPNGNLALGASTGTIAAQHSQLSFIGTVRQLPARAKAGRRLVVSLLLTNTGNVPVRNFIPFDLQLTTDGEIDANSIDLGTITRRVVMGVNRKTVIQLAATVPPGTTGSFTPIVEIDPNNTLGLPGASWTPIVTTKVVEIG